MTDRPAIAPWETWEFDVPAGMTAASLANEVERSTNDLLAAIAPLPDDALAAPETFDQWSGHDVLAHCLAWAEICAKVLEEMVAETLDLDDYRHLPIYDESEDELNQRQVDDLRDTPTDELVQRIERARDLATDALRRLEGDPPATLVLVTFGVHFDDHAEAFRKAAGI
jgi:Mycothiol maleylpyruvate isomerase N-terminal domain